MVHSLSLEIPDHLAPVLSAYEERFLCLVLVLLRQPATHVVYVTSQPILPRLVDYWLRLVPRVEAEALRRRLEVVSVADPHAHETFSQGDFLDVGFEEGRAWLMPVAPEGS